MDYEKISKRPNQLLSITSVTSEEFAELLEIFEKHLNRCLRYTTRGTIRLNGPSYPDLLPNATQFLFFTLAYFKNNTLQEYHAASFGMSQPSASRHFKTGRKCLNRTLNTLGYLPCRDGTEFAIKMEQRRKKLSTQEQEDEQEYRDRNGEHYFVDASDTRIERPVNQEEQTTNYSGKHHWHEVKNTFISNEYRDILYLGPTSAGTIHDKKMLDEEQIVFPQDAFLWKDLGYVGYSPEQVQSFELHKKPKGAELSKLQKQENTAISSVRIVIEHTISGFKRCRIVKEIMRFYDLEIRDTIIETCAALHNFRNNRRGKCKLHPIFS